jgi:anti-sigma regulatory factor (Ser/Thr protein kinase)
MKLEAKPFGIFDRLEELAINLSEMKKAILKEKTSVDLSTVQFVTPLAILPLAVYANHYGLDIDCTEDPYCDACRYLKTIKFQYGVTSLPSGDKRYLPITKLPPVEDNNVLGEYEERILSQANAAKANWYKNSIKYLTSELVNNINEHAQINHYWILAQYYQFSRSKTCEIVIADNGIGYKKSYQDTEFEVETDAEAIENALEGRSSKSAKARLKERGKGIPSIANIFLKGYGGKLVIISGRSIMYYKQDTKKEIELDAYWKGSVVCINFNVKDVNMLNYVDV